MAEKSMSQTPAIEQEHIEGIILAFLRDELIGEEAENIDVHANLLTSGLVDSVAIVRLIGHVEKELAVAVPPTDLVPENFRTARVMAVYLRGLIVA